MSLCGKHFCFFVKRTRKQMRSHYLCSEYKTVGTTGKDVYGKTRHNATALARYGPLFLEIVSPGKKRSVSSHPVSVWVSVIVMSLCYDYVIVMFHFFAKLLQKINIFYIYISILCTYISNFSSNIIFAKEKFWKVAHSLWKVANLPTMIY